MKRLPEFSIFLFFCIFFCCGFGFFIDQQGQVLLKSKKSLNLPPTRDLLFPKIPLLSGDYHIVGETKKGFSLIQKGSLYYVDDYLIVNKTYPLPSDYESQDTFMAIDGKNNCATCMHKTVYHAFEKMKHEAKKEGINLFIASGYRSYRQQKELYQNYVRRDGQRFADRYSARPGYSEHQTSLAFDLNQVSSEFEYTKAGKWLNANAYKFGFILRYPKGREDITGYMYESWHFRYVGTALSYQLWNEGNRISLEEWFGIDSLYSD